MKRINKIKLVFLFLILPFQHGISQTEYFLSAIGQQASPFFGAKFDYVDYWIFPQGNSTGHLFIFDASLGSSIDITLNKKLTTSFELFKFDDVYQLTTQAISKKITPQPTQSLILNTETEYLNRWSYFSQLPNITNGYILRVRSSASGEVNSFRLRVSTNSQTIEQHSEWQIFADKLSMNAFSGVPGEEAQLSVKTIGSPQPTMLSIQGEEELKVRIVDDFGNSFSISEAPQKWQQTLHTKNNRWGLSLSGATQKINNFSLTNGEDPTVWFSTSIMIKPITQKPKLSISFSPYKDCNQFTLLINAPTESGIILSQTEWFIDQRSLGKGIQISQSFSVGSQQQVVSLIPTTSTNFPAYWVAEGSLQVNTPPKAVISGVKSVIAPEEVLKLSARNSTDPEQKTLSYQWLVNNELKSRQSDFSFSSLIPGNYQIKLIVDDLAPLSFCTSDETTIAIRVNSQPFGEIKGTQLFSRNEVVVFSTQKISDGDNDPISFIWEGIGVTGDAKKDRVSIKHEQHGNFSVKLTLSDPNSVGNSTYQTSYSYRINHEPIPDFTLPVMVAPNQVFSLDGSLTKDPDSKNLIYQYNISDGRSLDGQKPQLTFDRPGSYQITLTVNDQENVSNSTQKITKNIHVNYPPIPIITAVEHSSKAAVLFSAENSTDQDQQIVNYLWSFGDGFSGIGKKLTHVFQKPGIYSVKLTIDDGQKMLNSIQSSEKKIIINAYPVANISGPDWIAPGVNNQFSGSESKDPDGEIFSYEWFWNGNPSGNSENTTINPTFSGQQIITLKVKEKQKGLDPAEIAIATKIVNVNHSPDLKWKATPEISEPGTPVIFNAEGSLDKDGHPLIFNWNFSDGTTLTGKQVTKTFTQSGTQTFSLTGNDGQKLANSLSTISGNYLVNHAPILVTEKNIRSNSRSILLDAGKTYDPDGHALYFTWVFPDGSKQNSSTFQWKAPTDGIHFISVIADDQLGRKNSKSSERIKVEINRPVVAILDSLVRSCVGQTILFSGAQSFDPDGDIFSVNWDFGDGQTSTETNPAHVFKTSGIFTVTASFTDGFQENPSIATMIVYVDSSPFAVMSISDTTVCVRSPFNVNGTKSTYPGSIIGAYSWDLGNGETAFGESATIMYKEKGVFTLTLTVIGKGFGTCTNISQVTRKITVIEGPQAIMELPSIVAINETVNFVGKNVSDIQSNLSYQWKISGSNDFSLSSSVPTFSHSFSQSGIYNVELILTTTGSSNCNSSTAEMRLVVNDPPIAKIVAADIYPAGLPYLLDGSLSTDADGVIQSFTWKINNSIVGTNKSFSVNGLPGGKHLVELEVTDNSNAKNNRHSTRKEFFINTSPTPDFTLQLPLYENQILNLSPLMTNDADGDPLLSNWFLDDKEIQFPLKLSTGNFTITLYQKDNRNLPNSSASISKKITVTPKPLLSFPVYHVNLGLTLTRQEVGLPEQIYFRDNDNQWTATNLNQHQADLIWKPNGEVLESYSIPVQVYQAMTFIPPQAKLIELTFDPANPVIQLKADDVNRDKNHPVLITWKSGNTILGYGKEITLTLKKGENIFVVEAFDQLTKGELPIRKTITIKAN